MKTILLAAVMLSLTAAGMPAPQPMPASEVAALHQRVLPKACPRHALVTNAGIIDLIVTGGAEADSTRRGSA